MNRARRRGRVADKKLTARLIHDGFDEMKQRIVVPEWIRDRSNSMVPEQHPSIRSLPAPDDPKWRLLEAACAALLVAGCVLVFSMHKPGTDALHRSVAASEVTQRIESALDSVGDVMQQSFPRKGKNKEGK